MSYDHGVCALLTGVRAQTLARASEVLPLTNEELPQWLNHARPQLYQTRRAGKVIKRCAVRAPWFVYGWIINVPGFVTLMRADAEWCKSKGCQDLLAARHATIDTFDKDPFLQYFFCDYIMEKMAPYHEEWDILSIVHGPLPGSMDEWAPNHFMIRLYDNRTPPEKRLSDEVVGAIQRAMRLREPVWTVRYGYLCWMELSCSL